MEDSAVTNGGSILLTGNKKGFMIQELDYFCQEFVDYSRTVTDPIADLGVAFGFTTKELLKGHATIIANDLSENHLDALWASVSDEDREKLILLPGNALDIELPNESLGGILACRWIHFLTGDELREVLSKFYRWLKPGGRLCLTAESVHLGSHKVIFHKYLKNKVDGIEWPGFVEVKELTTKRKEHMPDHLMLYDTDVLTRELQRARFSVLDIGYIDRPYYPEDLKNGGREAIGAYAVKPPQT